MKVLPQPRELLIAGTSGHPPVSSDVMHFLRNQVLEKPAQELHAIDRLRLPAAVVPVVLVAQQHVVAIDPQNPVVAQRHAVGVIGQVLERLLRVLRIVRRTAPIPHLRTANHPLRGVERLQPPIEGRTRLEILPLRVAVIGQRPWS